MAGSNIPQGPGHQSNMGRPMPGQAFQTEHDPESLGPVPMHEVPTGLPPGWSPAMGQPKVRNTGLCILWQILTFGIYGIFWLYYIHKEHPYRHNEDPTPGKAVGFLFIPIFNIYWVFKMYLSLTDRMNTLSGMYLGRQKPISRGVILAALICQFIPYIGGIPALILQIIWWVSAQGVHNELAQRAQGSPPR